MEVFGAFIVGAMATAVEHAELQPGMLSLKVFANQQRHESVLPAPKQEEGQGPILLG
jgi:hypothetical protein